MIAVAFLSVEVRDDDRVRARPELRLDVGEAAVGTEQQDRLRLADRHLVEHVDDVLRDLRLRLRVNWLIVSSASSRIALATAVAENSMIRIPPKANFLIMPRLSPGLVSGCG